MHLWSILGLKETQWIEIDKDEVLRMAENLDIPPKMRSRGSERPGAV